MSGRGLGLAILLGGVVLTAGACATSAPPPPPPRMSGRGLGVAILLGGVVLTAGACATSAPPPPPPAATPKPPAMRQSDDFLVVIPNTPETSASLAAQYLGDQSKAWMIEDYTGAAAFPGGQAVVIPKRPWNLTGVTATGYRLVPILVYHNLDRAAKGKRCPGRS